MALPVAHDPPSRKRRRSQEPDWDNFYRNGLPKEVIVIDDTPEPATNTNGLFATTHTNGNASVVAPFEHTATHQPVQLVQPTGWDAASSGYHVQYVGSSTNTPFQKPTFVHAAAPTSLWPDSQYGEAHAPPKRKRTTRQSVANEAKRRDVEGLGGPFPAYKPPPFPPKKVPNIHVRVVQDVSSTTCSVPTYPTPAGPRP